MHVKIKTFQYIFVAKKLVWKNLSCFMQQLIAPHSVTQATKLWVIQKVFAWLTSNFQSKCLWVWRICGHIFI